MLSGPCQAPKCGEVWGPWSYETCRIGGQSCRETWEGGRPLERQGLRKVLDGSSLALTCDTVSSTREVRVGQPAARPRVGELSTCARSCLGRQVPCMLSLGPKLRGGSCGPMGFCSILAAWDEGPALAAKEIAPEKQLPFCVRFFMGS